MKTIQLPETLVGEKFDALVEWCGRAARSDDLKKNAIASWDDEARAEYGDATDPVDLIAVDGRRLTVLAWVGLLLKGVCELSIEERETYRRELAKETKR